MQIESNLPRVIDVEARLDQIAARYKSAGGLGINVLNVIGGSAEGLIDKLPSVVRQNLESATVKALHQAMKAATGAALLPADAITTSGSGLDPHVSPAFAELQVPRIAQARGLTPQEVRRVISQNTAGRTLGVLGEPRVLVLGVNLGLDALAPNAAAN